MNYFGECDFRGQLVSLLALIAIARLRPFHCRDFAIYYFDGSIAIELRFR